MPTPSTSTTTTTQFNTTLSLTPSTTIARTINPAYTGFDHITWWVGNARQAASYYVTRLGFRVVAYRGVETGCRITASYVVANGKAVMVLVSPIRGPRAWEKSTSADRVGVEVEGSQKEVVDNDSHATADANASRNGHEKQETHHQVHKETFSESEYVLLDRIHAHLARHGDAVKDIAFGVDDVHGVWSRAVAAGAISHHAPTKISDANGSAVLATIQTFGETCHTLVDRSKYSGAFLPGYMPVKEVDPIHELLPKVDIQLIDHCVGNQPWDGLDKIVKYYEDVLDFHRYWSVDDKEMCSEYSAMRSIVIASPDEVIKMPMNEPANGKKKSQIEEFVDYYNGPGCQHIAFLTSDIISCVTALRARGLTFLSVPPNYYTSLAQRLSSRSPKAARIQEPISLLQSRNILIDFDEAGYLLQIFAKHTGDRPTVFVEIIQREGFDGFGAGNFKALFEAFEGEQAARGNL